MKKQTELKAIKKLRKKLFWKTADGRELLLKTMTTSHIQNTMIMLVKKQNEWSELVGLKKIQDYKINDLTATEWIEIFSDELEYRER